MAATLNKNTCLGAKYRRIAARRGPAKAVVALEHAMLIAIWTMATTGALYDDPGPDVYAQLHPDRVKQRAVNQLRALGYDVMLNPMQTPAA